MSQLYDVVIFVLIVSCHQFQHHVQAQCSNISDSTLKTWYEIPTIPKMCFHFDFSVTRQWSDAKAYCEGFPNDDGTDNAYLIEPSDAVLQQGIAAYGQLLGGGKNMWTGGIDQSSEGTWIWAKSSNLCYAISYIFLYYLHTTKY